MQAERGFQNRAEKLNESASTTAAFSTNQVQITHGARNDWEHRAIRTIQDKLALNPEEEAIELKREFIAGQDPDHRVGTLR